MSTISPVSTTYLNVETTTLNALIAKELDATRFDGLDGLRAIACILVLIAHFNIWTDFQPSTFF